MGEHLVLSVDGLVTPDSLQSMHGVKAPVSSDPSPSTIDIKEDEEYGEEEPLLQSVECRICQEEDSIKNMENPCACSGSLKFAHRKCVQRWCNEKGDITCEICHQFAHRKCVQRWCNEKGDITCEICHQPYQPGYTAPPPPPSYEDTTIDISGGWTISGTPLDLHDPRLLAMAAAERHLAEAEYDEYDDTNASGAAFCRSAALILMALLLLRHALTLGNGDEDGDDASTFFTLFLLRAAGFLLPCYIMAWAISILQRRRQRQEAAAALAATDVAFMIQAGQHRGLQVTIAPGPPPVPAMTPGPAASPQQVPLQ